MVEDFLSYIESNLSVFRTDKVLLSVSGGVDSMVMLHLFQLSGFDIEVAHINHSTRNGGSDRDMAFVRSYCQVQQIPIHDKTLDTEIFEEGNFQEVAREERFRFLNKIKEQRKCKWIATAHHKEDRWETFLMHLNRKAGLRGLTTLKGREEDLIHPMLIFEKEEILSYAKINHVPFVEDESNAKDDYLRNAIRHQVTPKIRKLMPDFINNANASIHHLEGSSRLLDELIQKQGLISVQAKKNRNIIDLEQVKTFDHSEELLYMLLQPYGYTFSSIVDILQTSITGGWFESENYEGVFDRGSFVFRAKERKLQTHLEIGEPGVYGLPNGKSLHIRPGGRFVKDKRLWLDASKLSWPIRIRNIEPGDKFKPAGMRGSTKTLKKLCSDLKINRLDKEEILLVCQKDVIVQVIGIRTSHDYTTDDIKNALTFSIVD